MKLALEYVIQLLGLIHCLNPYLLPSDLLDQVSYIEKKDTLIHLGDIIAKGPHAGSLSVLSFMSKHNISGVRGNHDQQVIEWRAWLDWIQGLEDRVGSRWLLELEERWKEDHQSGALKDDSDTRAWVKTEMRKGRKDRKWWSRIPKGWKLFSDHYLIARFVPSFLFDNWGIFLTNRKERCRSQTTNISCLSRSCFTYHQSTPSSYTRAYFPMTQRFPLPQSSSHFPTGRESLHKFSRALSQLSGMHKNSPF